MSSSAEAHRDDYWANEFEPGTSSTWRFTGREGLRRLSGPSTVTTLFESEFTAKLTRVQLDHVALEAFESTEHTSRRAAEHVAAFPTPLLTFVMLVDGGAQILIGDDVFEVMAGQYLVMDSRDPFSYRTYGRSRMLRAVVGLEHVDRRLHRRGATVPGPLARTALVDSYVAFISTILTSTATGRTARGDRLIDAVADLQTAVLAEAQDLRLDRDGPAGLRHRMEQYIEDRFTDPDLDPAAVAAAFGISLRRAHQVFNDDERTIARFIRDRRVVAVAAELRADSRGARLDGLAARYGFASRDVLARAFQQRFAMTPTEYRDGGHRRLD